ncbi:hypothetical protein [Rhodopirellula bahusiensis]|uniref:hypothetical protein n=2 Tax=Rhodopirellula bahusiensis TaxID=2014065 RepID=UPI00326708B1|nr:hypothetical protein [bacterium]
MSKASLKVNEAIRNLLMHHGKKREAVVSISDIEWTTTVSKRLHYSSNLVVKRSVRPVGKLDGVAGSNQSNWRPIARDAAKKLALRANAAIGRCDESVVTARAAAFVSSGGHSIPSEQ